jgi:hypothetical protein
MPANYARMAFLHVQQAVQPARMHRGQVGHCTTASPERRLARQRKCPLLNGNQEIDSKRLFSLIHGAHVKRCANGGV